MPCILRHNEGMVEEGLFTFGLRDRVLFPVLGGIAFIPLKALTMFQAIYHAIPLMYITIIYHVRTVRKELLILTLGGLTACMPASSSSPFTLTLIDDHSGTVLERLPVTPDTSFFYRYTHSTGHTLTEEVLTVTPEGELMLIGSRSEGHGLGHVPRRTPPRPVPGRPGWQEVTDLRVPLPKLTLFTGEAQADNFVLHINGKVIPLAKRYPRRHIRWEVRQKEKE